MNEMGGKLFYNRSDVEGEIKESQEYGSNYYTLTYQPQVDDSDGKFRRVRVTVRSPNVPSRECSGLSEYLITGVAGWSSDRDPDEATSTAQDKICARGADPGWGRRTTWLR